MRWLLWLALVGACAKPAAPRAPVVTPAVSTVPVSPWAVMPVRVMAWTASGVVELGELPGTLPSPMPARWYVEPIGRLDAGKLATLIGLVRSEHVPGLSLRGQAIAGSLDQLRDLPELAALVLDGTDVDGAALVRLDVAVTRLYLAHTAIDDEAVVALAARLPRLEVLDLEDTAVGDAGVRAIAALGELQALDLAGTQISDAGGAALGVLGKLGILDLGHTRVAGKTVAALRGLPLHELFLDHTKVKGEIATLAPLAPGLVRFDVSSTAHRMTDDELRWLTAATGLVELGVSGARLHDPLALQLIKPATLREVRLADTEITLTTIRVLAARHDLEEVDLGGTPVDDASAQAILAMPPLRIARLDDTPIGNAALAGAPGPTLVELYLSRTGVDDAGLAILDRTPRLAALGVGHTKIGDATLARIARLAALHTLVLSNTRAQPAALRQLGALRGLERLYLDQTAVDDSVIAALAPLAPSLRVLHLATSEVSDAALPALRGLTALEELTCGDTRLNGDIAELSAWPRLRTLSLIGLEIRDAALPQLAARPSLTVLDLSATEIRNPAALAALPRLRVLGLAQTRMSPAGVAAAKQLAARGVEIIK